MANAAMRKITHVVRQLARQRDLLERCGFLSHSRRRVFQKVQFSLCWCPLWSSRMHGLMIHGTPRPYSPTGSRIAGVISRDWSEHAIYACISNADRCPDTFVQGTDASVQCCVGQSPYAIRIPPALRSG